MDGSVSILRQKVRYRKMDKKKNYKSNILIKGVESWYNKRQVVKQCHINKQMAAETQEIIEISRKITGRYIT